MKLSQTGIDLIKSFEGLKLTAYKPVPTEKYWTIGYGHYGPDVKAGQKITAAEAEAMLSRDLVRYEGFVKDKYFVPQTDQLNQNQYDALVSFVYNCGQGNLKSLCGKSRTLKQIAEAMLLYDKAGGNVLAGLTRRRKAERELFLTPVKQPDKQSGMDKLEKVTAIVNGKEIEGAVLIDGVTLIPLRAAGDNIKGAVIDWNNKTKVAKLDTPGGK